MTLLKNNLFFKMSMHAVTKSEYLERILKQTNKNKNNNPAFTA